MIVFQDVAARTAAKEKSPSDRRLALRSPGCVFNPATQTLFTVAENGAPSVARMIELSSSDHASR